MSLNAAPIVPTRAGPDRPSRYAVVDVETTGFSASRGDRIVQVAVVQLDGDGRTERSWASLVDPGRDPGPTHVHGISARDLVGAPTFAAVAPTVADLTRGRILVAHHAVFDWGFLSAEFARAGVAHAITQRLCTRQLARRLDLPVDDFTLSTLAAHWGVRQLRAHDAEDDTRVLAEVLRRLLEVADRFRVDLPLVACEDVPALRSPAPGGRRSYPTPVPRVECPWVVPAAWSPGGVLVQGSQVVITGETATSRVDLADLAVRAGLDVKDAVSRRTTLLVCNDPTGGTRKLSVARRHGVPVVSEAEFERLLRAVAAGTRKDAPAPAPDPTPTPTPTRAPAARVRRVRPPGPLAGRRVLVLGGPHEAAVAARAVVVERGGTAAVNLTTTMTDVVALDGAERDPRWTRAQELEVPLLDLLTGDRTGPVLPAAPAQDGVVLPRGGVVDLPGAPRWTLDVRWAPTDHDVDVVALRLDGGSRVAGDEDLVFFGATSTPDRSVRLDLGTPGGVAVDLDLALLPPGVDAVVLAAVLPDGVTFGDVGPVGVALRTAGGAVAARATLDAATIEQTLVLGEVYRRSGAWRFRAQGQGYPFGLREFVERHGVEVTG